MPSYFQYLICLKQMKGIEMVNIELAREAVTAHRKFRQAVEDASPERFELGKHLETTLDKIDDALNEAAEIANALLPGNASVAEWREAKEATLKYVEAWRKWTSKVREDIQR